jgi:hypothetical protein
MPYIVRYSSDFGEGSDEDIMSEEWKEPNKDEVIDRLIWLLRRMEMEISVEYPDGSVW